MNHKNTRRLLLAAAAGALLLAGPAHPAFATETYLPDVTEEMTDPSFWAAGQEDADAVLADLPKLRKLNQLFFETPECRMYDLLHMSTYFKETENIRHIWDLVFQDGSELMRGTYYDQEGNVLTPTALLSLMENIGEGEGKEFAKAKYGICVHRTDLLSLPSDVILTDEQVDLNYNYLQLSAVRVGEPVLVKAVSADGKYYYVTTNHLEGWAAASDVAICSSRGEWLEAWDIPDDEAIVVTGGRIYLDASNVNEAISSEMLTMGTVLRKVSQEDYDAAVLQRAPYYNYAVWMPVRQEDGSYAKTIALIPQQEEISEGYVPLTENNILQLALSRLGDNYGWGGMLDAADCSSFMRDIYSCFGLILPRNTTWQAAMPVHKYDVSEATVEEKKAILDELPAGSALYLSGHTMLYLGKEGDQYYVISAVGNIMNEDETRLRIRSVAINTLDVKRMNGLTWLEALHTMLVPWQTEEDAEALAAEQKAAEEPVEMYWADDMTLDQFLDDIMQYMNQEGKYADEGAPQWWVLAPAEEPANWGAPWEMPGEKPEGENFGKQPFPGFGRTPFEWER